tara:strand:- start:5883 stop:6086 length:204 start_codon:yes stop_codon:yes gene_type:complete
LRQLGFEELMDIAFKARKLKNLKTLKEVNEEFNYRVERRIKLKGRAMKTSLSGQEQTKKWIQELENK